MAKKRNNVYKLIIVVKIKCSCYRPGVAQRVGRGTRFVQKVSGPTTVYKVYNAYGVLTLIVFRSYTLCPTFLPLLETFCELLFQDI